MSPRARSGSAAKCRQLSQLYLQAPGSVTGFGYLWRLRFSGGPSSRTSFATMASKARQSSTARRPFEREYLHPSVCSLRLRSPGIPRGFKQLSAEYGTGPADKLTSYEVRRQRLSRLIFEYLKMTSGTRLILDNIIDRKVSCG